MSPQTPPLQCDDSKAKNTKQTMQQYETKKINNPTKRAGVCGGGGARLFTHVSYICILTISKFKAQVA